VPRSQLELYRLQIMQELQTQTEQKHQSLTEEATRYREAYYDARGQLKDISQWRFNHARNKSIHNLGEADRLKAALEAANLEMLQREQRLVQQFDDMQRMLNDKIHSLQASNGVGQQWREIYNFYFLNF